MAFLSAIQIQQIGFLYTGNNILISDKASIYNPGQISIGDNCRVDDFCILSAGTGGIYLGRNVHLACYVSLIGKNKIVVDDFAGGFRVTQHLIDQGYQRIGHLAGPQ